MRILGIDDSSFASRKTGTATLIGLVFRGGTWLDGAMKTSVTIDGSDATERIIKMVKSSPHYDQLRVIMLNGITFATFNIVNIKQLFEFSGLPVIALTRGEPNITDLKEMSMKLSDWKKRLRAIREAGEAIKLITRRGCVYVQLAGVSMDNVEKILEISCTHSKIPEPLRVAHIVASGFNKQITEQRENNLFMY